MTSQFAALQSPSSELSFINLMTNRLLDLFISQKLGKPTSVLPGYASLSLIGVAGNGTKDPTHAGQGLYS